MKFQIGFCMFLQFCTCRVVCSSYTLPTRKSKQPGVPSLASLPVYPSRCFCQRRENRRNAFQTFLLFCGVLHVPIFLMCQNIWGAGVGGPCVEEKWGYTLLKSSYMRTSYYAT